MTVNPTTGLVTWRHHCPTSPAAVPVTLYAYDPSGSYSDPAVRHPGCRRQPRRRLSARCRRRSPARKAAARVARHRHRPGRPAARLLGRQPARRRLVRPGHPHAALGAGLRPGRHLQRRDLLRQRRREHSQHQHRALDRRGPAAAAARRAAEPDRARGRPPALHLAGQRRRRRAGHLSPAPTCPRTRRSNPNTGVFDWPIGYDQAGTFTVPFTATSDERR